jgi:hypothetical protein
VPAAAVIRRGQALFGFIGRKGHAGCLASVDLKTGAQLRDGLQTALLEYGMGDWNSTCRGEICRDVEEYRWRRRVSGLLLTLMCESVGSEQD